MTTFKLKDKLTFGKYKGQSVDEVIDNDPDYLAWAVEEIDWFKLDEEADKKLVAEIDISIADDSISPWSDGEPF